jgi:hypothetical protein
MSSALSVPISRATSDVQAIGVSERRGPGLLAGRVPHCPVEPAVPVCCSRLSVKVKQRSRRRLTRNRTPSHPGFEMTTCDTGTLQNVTTVSPHGVLFLIGMQRCSVTTSACQRPPVAFIMAVCPLIQAFPVRGLFIVRGVPCRNGTTWN